MRQQPLLKLALSMSIVALWLLGCSLTSLSSPKPTSAPFFYTEPAWSPDGTHIAFVSNRDGNFEIYTMDSSGGNVTRLTNDTARDDHPDWSPDGARIAFDSTRDSSGNYDEIYVMDADGSNVSRLTDNPAGDDQPDWSPDGKHIAFTSSRAGDFEIYTMEIDNLNATRLLADQPAEDEHPTWSPDGGLIAFDSNRNDQDPVGCLSSDTGCNWEIYVINGDGSNLIRLTDDPAEDDQPDWSPDGGHIAFVSNRDGNREIYVMDADGDNATNTTNKMAGDGNPAWSPDGTRIAFSSNRDGTTGIYVMDADGSNVKRLI
jgi:Tol biopolymer transport system component